MHCKLSVPVEVCGGGETRPDWWWLSEGGSVDEERARELHKVEGGRQLAAFAVQVRLHVRQAVVGLLLGQVLEDRGEGGEVRLASRARTAAPPAGHHPSLQPPGWTAALTSSC